jgi:hypothetical protein
MRAVLALFTLSLAIAPAAHSQPYGPVETSIDQDRQSAQLEIDDYQTQQNQTQQNGLLGAPQQSGLQGQVLSDQSGLRHLQTQDIPAQMQQEQAQQDEIDQAKPAAPSPTTH